MMRFFYPVAAIVLICDIVTKQIVYRNMDLYQSIPVFGDWFLWTYIHNYGAAFGLFEGSRWVFVVVSIVSVFVLVALARSPRYQRTWTLIALGLILGGAIGNLLDRLWLGKVIDFINIGIGQNRWPYFNIADSGISVGVVLLALQMLREGSHPDEDEVDSSGAEVADGTEATKTNQADTMSQADRAGSADEAKSDSATHDPSTTDRRLSSD